ncbi:hypothetical protein JIR23_12560 [Bradyrhizobium diazoefficiens]|nr:hypothetical protein [Bradyrhizobium diazoefficiens]QQN66455.1 hypothetical protein JIR23_12560 [Bradyrhizobium diazoefficiens]
MPPIPAMQTQNFAAISFQGPAPGINPPGVLGVLALTLLICGVSSCGLTSTHFVPFCGDLGLPVVTSAGLLAMIGGSI